MDELAHGSVAPPRWPGTASVATAVPAARGQSAPEAAIRARFAAAVIDGVIVWIAYLALCLVFGWRVFTLAHLLAAIVIDVLYHTALESRSGQSIGKRQYDIHVVALDGSRAGVEAIALRSVLRIVDAVPAYWLSGLISMLRTGPERRQRIGDVAGGTIVVDRSGLPARLRTPGWMLPAATILATAASAVSLWTVLHDANTPLTPAQRQAVLSSCETSPDARFVSCSCILTAYEAAGYSTPAELNQLDGELLAGRAPRWIVLSLQSCRR
jgi:uncharacterized RDD family membrane protein YckC